MQPLQLTLKGFRGIRDGLGLAELHLDLQALAGDAALVAITGPNGTGKTTVMDNLTPYNLLASRGAKGASGGFSYYEHVYLPENLKDLLWMHEGRRYRSQIVVRLNGRRRTEAFLHRLEDDGAWQPVVLDDGTRADGRLESYNACVECLCGSAETFFTSVFAAQGRRPLSDYRNAEIKGLLADLLGQEQILALGTRAAETARLLKSGLVGLRRERDVAGQEAAQVREALQRLGDVTARQTGCTGTLRSTSRALDCAVADHARRAAEQLQQQSLAKQRARLLDERNRLDEEARRAAQALEARDQTVARRLARLQQAMTERAARDAQQRGRLLQRRAAAVQMLAQAKTAELAARRLPRAQHLHARRMAATQASRGRARDAQQAQTALQLAEQRLAALEREAGKAVLRLQELTRRSGLVHAVPCAGTDLQGRCALLDDARGAKALQPDAHAVVARCAQERRAVLRERAEARRHSEALAGAGQALAWAERCEVRTAQRLGRCRELVAVLPACAQARLALAEVEGELAALAAMAASTQAQQRSPQERAERAETAQEQREIAHQRAQARIRLQDARGRLDAELAALPVPTDEALLRSAAQAVVRARAAHGQAQQAAQDAALDAQSARTLQARAQVLAPWLAARSAHCAGVERAVGDWTLLARCLGHDGLIALAIDDVGPTLAALANDLLLATHGPRFTLALRTQHATGKGALREGFEIVVHDGTGGEPKSLGFMSGGERTWIEACLVRAVALYLAMHTGRRYSTLFSDEADGALDPERKRMFMAMKRAVLKLGGYRREYFVTQTPELAALADAVIDLEALRRPPSTDEQDGVGLHVGAGLSSDAWCSDAAECDPAV
jgi:exonuclease SbcC